MKDRLHGGGEMGYTMDGLGRLTEYDSPDALGDLTDQSWVLDKANNWNKTTRTLAGSTSTENRTHNENNELVEAGATEYAYDENGNLINDGAQRYKWDFKNRLREVWDTQGTASTSDDTLATEYWYDAENRRTRKEVAGESTLYFLDAWNEVQESDCLGRMARQYVHAQQASPRLRPRRLRHRLGYGAP